MIYISINGDFMIINYFVGQHLALPMLGYVVELHIPALSSRHTDSSNETVTVNGAASLATPVPDLFPTLLPLVEHLHFQNI